MKPKYVKITKPEKKLVKQFTAVVIKQSLQENYFSVSNNYGSIKVLEAVIVEGVVTGVG